MGAAWCRARLSLFGISEIGLGLSVAGATATELQTDMSASTRYNNFIPSFSTANIGCGKRILSLPLSHWHVEYVA
jgi:hypothetical protein